MERVEVAIEALRSAAERALAAPGWRFGHATARVSAAGHTRIEVLLLDTGGGALRVLSAPLPEGAASFPSLTPHVPAAHWAERAIGDMFGLRAEGHPRWKSVLLHEAWPAGLAPLRIEASPQVHSVVEADQRGSPPSPPIMGGAASSDTPRSPHYWGVGGADPIGASGAALSPRDPYTFLQVEGEGVHEIPVGPIHAGIIEPGHFRFSCVGEEIANLEIRLGYQHRGLERRLAEAPWEQGRFLAEAASSDTAVGNALAHAVAVEQLLEIAPPPRAEALRTMALEVERVASHLGDIGALSGDIGYSAGATVFSRLRGGALGLGEILTGSRLQRAFVTPGGVTRDLDDERRSAFARALAELTNGVRRSLPLVLEHSSVIDRMEGTGRISPSLAREFGLVGPAARAGGSRYDARQVFRHGLYPERAPDIAHRETGDVLARAQVRAEEITASLALLAALVEKLGRAPGSRLLAPGGKPLPPDAVGIGVVEAWRGELIHWITTDDTGAIQRYAIKDPSFNNWTGLAIAVRGNLVGDFPLCNKSFNLSYSGNDL